MQGSVWTSVWRAFGRPWAAAGLIKLLHDCINLSTPYLLKRLLSHKTQSSDIWVGLGWAAALFVAGVAVAVLVNHYFHQVLHTCLSVKAALGQALYAKSLRMSLPARAAMGGAGAIANLQSNDAEKVWRLANYGHVVWSGPFQARHCESRANCAALPASVASMVSALGLHAAAVAIGASSIT